MKINLETYCIYKSKWENKNTINYYVYLEPINGERISLEVSNAEFDNFVIGNKYILNIREVNINED